MKHTIIRKDNGKFGIKRIASGGVYGDFETMVAAMEALGQSQAADASATAGREHY
jgi:hypothetical protein